MEYSKWIPTRTHQSGFVVEKELVDFYGNYEYVGKHNGDFHFYDDAKGVDVYISKEDIPYIEKRSLPKQG